MKSIQCLLILVGTDAFSPLHVGLTRNRLVGPLTSFLRRNVALRNKDHEDDDGDENPFSALFKWQESIDDENPFSSLFQWKPSDPADPTLKNALGIGGKVPHPPNVPPPANLVSPLFFADPERGLSDELERSEASTENETTPEPDEQLEFLPSEAEIEEIEISAVTEEAVMEVPEIQSTLEVLEVSEKQQEPEVVVSETKQKEPDVPATIPDDSATGPINIQEDLKKAATGLGSALYDDVVAPLFSTDIQKGVSAEAIKGAALTGAALSLLAGQSLAMTGAAGLGAAYVAISPGKGGEALRALGGVTWESAQRAAQLYQAYGTGRKLTSVTKAFLASAIDAMGEGTNFRQAVIEADRQERQLMEAGQKQQLDKLDSEVAKILSDAQEAVKGAEEAQSRLANEARLAEERLSEEARKFTEARVEAIARKADATRLAKEARKAEKARKEENVRRLEEEARLAEEEALELAEQARLFEEDAVRLEEEVRAEERSRFAEETRLAEEARMAEEERQAEVVRLAEEARIVEEQRQAEEARRLAEVDEDEMDDEDWEASIQLAKSLDGNIVGFDDAIIDEGERAEWEAARKLAQELGKGTLEVDDEPEQDLELLAKAAREAVEKFEAEMKTEEASKTRQRQQWDNEMFVQEEEEEEDYGSFSTFSEEVDLEELGRAARAAVAEFEAKRIDEDEIPADKTDMEELGRAARLAVEMFELGVTELEELDKVPTDWSKFTVAQLREELRSRGLKTTGKKTDLVTALEASDLEISGDIELEGEELVVEEQTMEIPTAEVELDMEELGRAARAAVEIFEQDNGAEVGDIDFTKLTVTELKDELRNRGLKITGKKAELIERLVSSL